ncbi:MAG: hypothetical protein HKN07_15545 [Acidimicrobiia bacterium]|nr:hypothetical protein [Acidimicrobiia bacterium]NNF65657.1 hypothetical protein [Acidimicrobiia bacterium]
MRDTSRTPFARRLVEPRLLQLIFAAMLFVAVSPSFSMGVTSGSWGSALLLGMFAFSFVAFLRHINEKKRQLERLESSQPSDAQN